MVSKKIVELVEFVRLRHVAFCSWHHAIVQEPDISKSGAQ